MIPLRALVDLTSRRINTGFINLKRLANECISEADVGAVRDARPKQRLAKDT